MAIVVSCTGCGRKLRLTEEHAGKTARCPVCRMTFQVPSEGLASVGDSVLQGEPTSSANLAASDDKDELRLADDPGFQQPLATPSAATAQPERWHVRTPEGQEFGPAVKSDLDLWVAERRVTADCWLRKDGTTHWQGARELYPHLTPTAAGPAGSSGSGYPAAGGYPGQPAYGQPGYVQPNPFSDQAAPGYPPGAINPYASPYAPSYGMPYAYKKPHRGGTILAMGIAGFFCCVLINIGTLIMANQDLTEMDRGLMDDSGRGLTRAGQIIAIVNIVLSALWIGINIIAGVMS